MADRSLIEWTDTTWQIVTGCSVVSPGCTNCYAMKLAGTRMKHHPTRAGLTIDTKAGPVWNGQVRFNEAELTKPLSWRRPRKIFVAAHGDLFHEGVTDAELDKVFAVAALCPQHTFQMLTKRPERMRAYLSDPQQKGRVQAQCNRLGVQITGRASVKDSEEAAEFVSLSTCDWPLPNVWLGVSVEDQVRADERIPLLLQTPSAVRWISAEPLLGPVNLESIKVIDRPTPNGGHEAAWESVLNGKRFDPWGEEDTTGHPRLDWVVAGGESGPASRPMHPDWARQLRDQCAVAGVAFLFKQWGAWTPGENAGSTVGRTAEAATWFNDGWHHETITARVGEEMHADDEPTVWRTGKKAAGRLLDGRLHDGYPATSEARG